jgi:hypothetical protein
MGLPDLARALGDLQAQKEFLEDQTKELNKDIEVLVMSIIPEMMADLEVSTITIEDVGRLQTRADAWVTVLAGDREEVHDWMRENGHESMVKETIHAGTLKAFIKQQVKNGEEYPQHLIKHEAYEKAVLVKS